jgi:acylphosphatase
VKCVHLRIHGRVQGVGYRESLREAAERLGVRGWVRNRSDGSVEALACGPAAAVDALAAWCERGPPLAQVLRVESAPAPVEDERGTTWPELAEQGFRRLPSA